MRIAIALLLLASPVLAGEPKKAPAIPAAQRELQEDICHEYEVVSGQRYREDAARVFAAWFRLASEEQLRASEWRHVVTLCRRYEQHFGRLPDRCCEFLSHGNGHPRSTPSDETK